MTYVGESSVQALPGRGAVGRRVDVLRTLRDSAIPLGITDIADTVGVHPNTVRFHLKTLVQRGHVEQVTLARQAPGRPPQLFQAVRGMDPTGPRHYRLLAEVLTDALVADPRSSSRAVEVGRAWGRRQASASDGVGSRGTGDAVERLVALLDELDFAPERRQGSAGAQIALTHCPFLELAATSSRVVCQIHLGLMQGAMDAWQSPVTVDRLDAFVEPDLCLAHLSAVGVAAAQ